jgi:hypothetical protein
LPAATLARYRTSWPRACVQPLLCERRGLKLAGGFSHWAGGHSDALADELAEHEFDLLCERRGLKLAGGFSHWAGGREDLMTKAQFVQFCAASVGKAHTVPCSSS